MDDWRIDIHNEVYDTAVSRYEAIKAEREKVAADIRQRGIRRREFERFITELEKLPVSEHLIHSQVGWVMLPNKQSPELIGLNHQG